MANEYLERISTTSGNRMVFTWSGWVRRNSMTSGVAHNALFSTGNSTITSPYETAIYFNTNDQISVVLNGNGASTGGNWTTTYRYRDVGSFLHVTVSLDNTVVLFEDRVKIYINGARAEISSYGNAAAVSIGFQGNFNTISQKHAIGRHSYSADGPLEGTITDQFFIDGQVLTPDVFGFYKEGNGYISVGSTLASDFRPGQWVPKTPRVIKTEINRRGGFGINGFYIPMNDSANYGADFHCTPNSIIKLQEDLPQPKVSIDSTAQSGLAYTDVLRNDPYSANLVLALPFVKSGLCTNGTSSGINTGFGDYSHIIRGSGTPKVGIITAASTLSIVNVAAGETAGCYYGSGAKFTSGSAITFANNSDFNFGTGDFTVEGWVYRVNSAGGTVISLAENVGVDRRSWQVETRTSEGIRFEWWTNGTSASGSSITVNSVCPTKQWNHFAFVRKGNIVTGYMNGNPVGVSSIAGVSFYNNTVDPLRIGVYNNDLDAPFYGYIQDIRVYKGVAKYTGPFDVPNQYTPVGIHTWRGVSETFSNDFAILDINSENPSLKGNTFDGNLRYDGILNDNRDEITSTVGVSTGKWYFEVYTGAIGNQSDSHTIFISNRPANANGGSYRIYPNSISGGTYPSVAISNISAGTARFQYQDTAVTFAPAGWWADGSVVGFAFDIDGGSLSFYKNGVLGMTTSLNLSYITSGIGSTVGNSIWIPGLSFESTSSRTPATNWVMNFGQNPSFSGQVGIGTFSDDSGKGRFKYQPPSGYLAICKDNLPTPTISNPGKYFKTVLYKGDGNSSRNIVGVGFTPDLVWLKTRTGSSGHRLTDSIRGGRLTLSSSAASNEVTDNNGNISSLNSDGFSVLAGSSDASAVNNSDENYVAWCWRAGAGTTSTNTDGSLTSIISVSQESGFSIVSYTGNGVSNATVGHGLGKVPAFGALKCRDTNTVVNGWRVQHKYIQSGYYSEGFTDNSSSISLISGTSYGSLGSFTSSSTVTLQAGTVDSTTTNESGKRYIMYLWSEIEGFSKAFQYKGNGSSDGPFVYLGFKPAFLIIRRYDGAGNWQIYDSSRISGNPNTGMLFPNSNVAERTGTGYEMDFLSNGFKLRSTDSDRNTSNSTYFGFAWAECPFTSSNAK